MSVLITVTQTGGEPDPMHGIGLIAVLAAAVEPPEDSRTAHRSSRRR